jgi:hypothetical protein
MGNLESQSSEVYVFGAGLNRCMYNMDLLASPPLIEDFFQIAIKANERFGKLFDSELIPLIEYIKSNWKLSKNDLLTRPFNLENCFTTIEYQYRNALLPGSFDSLIDLFDLRFKLRTLIFRVLSLFDGCQFQSELMILGQILFNKKPGIISFNYDDFVESVIEVASQRRINQNRGIANTLKEYLSITDKNVDSSIWNWNRALAYGINFDLVMIHDSSMHTPDLREYTDGGVFYKHENNKLYTWNLLKLHGSLNWFRFIPNDATPPSLPQPRNFFTEEMENQIILGRGDWELKKYPRVRGRYVEPVIVTPDIYKSKRFDDPIFKKALSPIWNKAGRHLSKCKKLIIIGYSFPEADDLVKKMFQTAFSNNVLDKLIIVNPDLEAVEKAKALCRFNDAFQFNNLKEFLVSEAPSRTE